MVFAVYATGALFPITNATEQVEGTNASITTVVGSSVLGVTVGLGQNFSNLTEPVRILLRLHELEVGCTEMCEKCMYRIAGNFRWCKILRKRLQTLQEEFSPSYFHGMNA